MARSTVAATPPFTGNGACGTRAENREERTREGIQLLRELAPRTPWNAAADAASLVPLAPGVGRDRGADLSALLLELGRGAGREALQDLCITLRGGGYQTAEAVCEAGGVEVTLDVLAQPSSSSQVPALAAASDLQPLAAEALWLMMYDHDSSQRLIDAGGHRRILRLLRDEGPSGCLALSRGALRVIGETLYSEPRNAEVWATGDLDLVVEALDWALRLEPASERGPVLAVVLNVAALWVWRARGVAVEALLPLIVLLPRLLQELSARSDDAEVLQQGCRLIQGLAGRSSYWPDNVREPTMVALQRMSSEYSFAPLPGGNAFSITALKAVQNLPPEPPIEVRNGGLSTMD